MIISEETLEPFEVSYDVNRLGVPEQLLFLDIETTGFTARTSSLYLIGCAYYATGYWRTIQWLAERPDEEATILQAFYEFAENYKTLVHFNGNHFDLPFLTQKCEMLDLNLDFSRFSGIDLYKRISTCKFFLKLPNCKQKTLEQFLGIDRKDVFTGGELISIYQDYVKTPTEFALSSLMLHNEDDLKGMLQILPVLAYYDMFQDSVRAKKVQANQYKDFHGDTKLELLIYLALPVTLPKTVSVTARGCYFRGEGEEGTLKIPIYEEEMRYFYANYHDYYYLPEEDVALHKSVATFVDRSHREQATAATCYTRKRSRYLPQWGLLFEPFYKRDYHSKELFFELTEEMKRNRDGFSQYASHVLSMIKTEY